MIARRIFVALAAFAVLGSTTAFAGGGNGGSKKDPIIKVTNESGEPVAFFINPVEAKLAVLEDMFNNGDDIDAEDIEEAGGKLANSGDTVEFTVKQGTNVLAAFDMDLNEDMVRVRTSKGRTYAYEYDDNVLDRI